ncbi:MAG: efflux RND transporter periplasmic adaptor subunit [Allosphingosinicella sp.]
MLAAGVSGWALERYVFKAANPWPPLRSAALENADHEKDNRRILYWVAPMDPGYRRDGPGKSPMGMDLIPVYEGEEPEEPGVVRVSAAAAGAIGVRYATLQRETLTPKIRTFGRVAYDERRTRHIHVRADGWVDRLDVRREGERVRKGDLLFTYFAPDLSIAAMEYMRELQRGDQAGINATRLKLRSLGVSERQIGALRPGSGIVENIEVYAPQDGVIAEIDIAEGMFITPDIPVVSLSDLSRVWVLAEVMERDIPHVRAGMAATIEAASGVAPARSGVIDTIFPTLKEDTRTIELRLMVDNPDGVLHPNAFVKVALESDPLEQVLTAPASAVIRLGEAARVVQVMGDGRFRPVPVAIGPRIGDRIVVEDGLQEGDRIVAAGHFLIDSESSLQDGLDRLAAHGAHQGGAHQGMDHGQPAPADNRDSNRGSSGDSAEDSTGDGTLVWAEGKIVAIEAERRAVTLDHAPVPALGWPGMVMDFRVGADVPIESLRIGDGIAFGFVQTPDGRYEIRQLRPSEPHSGHRP